MCATCLSIAEKIQKARAENNPEKERIMTVLFTSHWKWIHPVDRFTVLSAQDFIIWPCGVVWKVAE
jgi:hypothetical protein